MLKIYRRIGFTRLALFVMLTVGVLELAFGEKYGDAQGGALFDGVGYINCVQNLPKLLSEKTINTAIGGKTNRFAPSILVHYGIKLSGYDIQNKSHIFWAYIYHNIFWVLLGTWTWGQIGKLKKLSERNKWLGLVLLFFSCAFLKYNFGYTPIMTDTAVFVCGVLLIYFYIHPNRYTNKIGLIAVGLFGAFTWQTVQIYAYIFLLFPYGIKIIESKSKGLKIAVYTIPLLIFTYGFTRLYLKGGKEIFNRGLVGSFGQLPLYERGFWVTVIFAAFFTFFYYKELYAKVSLANLRSFLFPNILLRLLPVVLLHLSIGLIHHSISPENLAEPAQAVFSSMVSGGGSNISEAISGIISRISSFFFYSSSIHYPFEIIVAHAVYFGLVYIIGFLFFPQIAKHIRAAGPGMILLFTASFLTLANPQSRIHTPLVPFIVFFTMLFANERKWPVRHYIFIFLVSLIASKVWLPFGTDIGNPAAINEMTWLRFHMNLGTWANMQWHAIHTFLFCLIAGWFILFRKELVGLEDTAEGRLWLKIKSKFVK